MSTRNEKNPQDKSIANESKRARLNAMLYSGAKAGTALLALSLFLDPKIPPFVGE